MAKFIPPGFDADRIIDGLHKAMGFGEPTRVEDKATFFFAITAVPTGRVDRSGVPFDPADRPANTVPPRSLQVACAVEFFDREGQALTVGTVKPSRIKVTLLDPEWQLVRDFRFIVVGGDKYIRSHIEPPVALGSIDVWSAWATAEDET